MRADRLSEAFKDGCSDMNRNSRLDQSDFGIWSPTSEEESKKHSKMAGSSSIRSELNNNQQEAIKRAIAQI